MNAENMDKDGIFRALRAGAAMVCVMGGAPFASVMGLGWKRPKNATSLDINYLGKSCMTALPAITTLAGVSHTTRARRMIHRCFNGMNNFINVVCCC
jgi:hypothetical protein